ncbi:MAG: (deoxy)nucleoside triphosphate pyrophosphohydrolase [Ruminiclostridium sp.]|nr:(deoxy)nucleoside triphosphate pyrophosphohydrolase [Ruminiclostridium sp.]
MIQVTAAVIRDGEKVMICRRPQGKRFGGQWEFPGGKVEPGESLFDCIVRECQEELCILIEPQKEIVSIEIGDYTLHFIEAVIVSGEVTLNEHEAVEWIRKDDIDRFEFCSGDRKALEFIWESRI